MIGTIPIFFKKTGKKNEHFILQLYKTRTRKSISILFASDLYNLHTASTQQLPQHYTYLMKTLHI